MCMLLSQYLYTDVSNQLLQQDQEILAAHGKVCKYFASSDEHNASQHRVHIAQMWNNIGQGFSKSESVGPPFVYLLGYVPGCLS